MERLFTLSGLLVLPFWALMIFLPRWRRTEALVRSPLIVLGPALLYAALVLPALAAVLPVVARPALAPVAALLGSPLGTTVAWAHFLAFDLFVGRWIFLDAKERGLPALLVSPLLALTLLLGPLGLGGYLLARGSAGRWLAAFVRRAAAANRPLVALALGSAALLVVSLVMQQVDGRQVLGASTWLKPAKFAAAVAVSALTLAWMLRHFGGGERGVARAAWVIVATTTLELVIITVQSARGVASHFNNGTRLDFALFVIMGAAITVFWAAQGYLGLRALRSQFADPILGWGIRLGLVVALLGGAQGFFMPRPTAAQIATLKAGEPTPLLGGHSVGAPDGGPGLPVTRWNTQAGDLRVAHFIGLHGLQALPLLAWACSALVRPRRREARPLFSPGAATRLVIVASGGYLGLVAATLVQALRARPLLAADGPAIAAGAVVLAAFSVVALLAKPSAAAAITEGRAASPAMVDQRARALG
jgi:hypothetical protein